MCVHGVVCCILLHLILISSATRHTYLNDPIVCVPSFVIVTYKFPLERGCLLLCKHVTDVKGGSLHPFVRTKITSEPRLLVTVFVLQFTKEMELQYTEHFTIHSPVLISMPICIRQVFLGSSTKHWGNKQAASNVLRQPSYFVIQNRAVLFDAVRNCN